MRTHIHKGRVIDVGTEDVTLPSGVKVTLDVIQHPGAALIVPLDGDRVTLIRQYRHCAHGYLWEAPAGTLNPGETPEQCAHREIVEEAGLVAGELHYAGKIFTAPGFCDEVIHIYIATKTRQAQKNPDEDEVITEVRSFTFAEAAAMVADRSIEDAKTIAALFHAQRFLSARTGPGA
jgi:ADP-ribose pyrophosphatase